MRLTTTTTFLISPMVVTVLLIDRIFVNVVATTFTNLTLSSPLIRRCCANPSALHETMRCVSFDDEDDDKDINEDKDGVESTIIGRIARMMNLSEEISHKSTVVTTNATTTTTKSRKTVPWICFNACLASLSNGSTALLWLVENDKENVSVAACETAYDHREEKKKTRNETNDSSVNNTKDCLSIFEPINLWGANIVVFANVIYILPYVFVVLVYTLVCAELRTRAYDGAVLSYNVGQIISNSILIGIGSSRLCNVVLNSYVYTISCLGVMFLTISSTSWLFVICFDMTLSITRFRWAPPNDGNRRKERRKFLVYSIFVWSGALLPTIFACIMELTPQVPRTSLLKPNFDSIGNGPNLAVIIYVAALPALTCLVNSILFVYTTYKVTVMSKSTSFANNAATENARRSYFVFLKLYFLMDAPWVTSALGAIFTELWILKFFRMVQPILMLLAILPKGTLKEALNAYRPRCCNGGCCCCSTSTTVTHPSNENAGNDVERPPA